MLKSTLFKNNVESILNKLFEIRQKLLKNLNKSEAIFYMLSQLLITKMLVRIS